MLTTRSVALAILLMLLSFHPASAFRCDGKLVDEGDSKFDVLRLCGEPDYEETIRIEDWGWKIVKTDQWFYDCGYNRFIRILTFREGRLINIETGSYGTGENRCE